MDFTQQGVNPTCLCFITQVTEVSGGLRDVFTDTTGDSPGKTYSIMIWKPGWDKLEEVGMAVKFCSSHIVNSSSPRSLLSPTGWAQLTNSIKALLYRSTNWGLRGFSVETEHYWTDSHFCPLLRHYCKQMNEAVWQWREGGLKCWVSESNGGCKFY